MQTMSLNELFFPYLFAVGLCISYRFFKPIIGHTYIFVLISSISACAVGIFAGLLLGGTQMADDPMWKWVACPLIAFALTIRIQDLAVDWNSDK
jgi:hypothetical protein